MKIKVWFFCLYLLLPSPSGFLFAQALSDSAFVVMISHHMNDLYFGELKSEAPIYNGKMYHPVSNLDEGGHALFLSNQYTKGTLVYNANVYHDVNLMYDLVRDELVLLNFDQVGGIVVWPDCVDAFSLHQHTFIHIGRDSVAKKGITPGYYDLLYKGKTSLLAKRIKTITEVPDQYKVNRTVSEENRYYLLKDSVYTLIKSRKDLLRLLGPTRAENLRYIKKEHINFKKNKENAMVRIVSYNDSIL